MTVEEMWQAHSAKLRRYVHRRLSDFHAAEDIVQEVALRLNKSSMDLQEIADPERWLRSIAHNLIVDHYRRRQSDRQLQTTGEMGVIFLPDDENADEKREAAECLLRLSASLPPKYRQALLSADYLGVPQKQLSAELGLSYSGYKSRVQRARRQLKSAMLSCCRVRSDRYGNILAMERKEKASGKSFCPNC